MQASTILRHAAPLAPTSRRSCAAGWLPKQSQPALSRPAATIQCLVQLVPRGALWVAGFCPMVGGYVASTHCILLGLRHYQQPGVDMATGLNLCFERTDAVARICSGDGRGAFRAPPRILL